MSLTFAQMGAIDLAKRMLVSSVYTSCCIEGLSTTFPVTERILDNLTVEAKPSDVVFVLNMRNTWKFIVENIDYTTDLVFIRELNRICGRDLIRGSGELRTVGVRIGGSTYIPPIPDYVSVVHKLSEINRITKDVDRAIEMFCYVAKTQLFIDGNKRVAQLVANKVLIEAGKGILYIPDSKVAEFKELLVEYYEGDATGLPVFLRSCFMPSQTPETVEYDGAEYLVSDILSEVQFSVRRTYTSDLECAKEWVAVYAKYHIRH